MSTTDNERDYAGPRDWRCTAKRLTAELADAPAEVEEIRNKVDSAIVFAAGYQNLPIVTQDLARLLVFIDCWAKEAPTRPAATAPVTNPTPPPPGLSGGEGVFVLNICTCVCHHPIHGLVDHGAAPCCANADPDSLPTPPPTQGVQ